MTRIGSNLSPFRTPRPSSRSSLLRRKFGLHWEIPWVYCLRFVGIETKHAADNNAWRLRTIFTAVTTQPQKGVRQNSDPVGGDKFAMPGGTWKAGPGDDIVTSILTALEPRVFRDEILERVRLKGTGKDPDET